MPELPEVETIVRQLAEVLPGHRIRQVTIHHPNLVEGRVRDFQTKISGEKILAVGRRGKNIVISLSKPQFLIVHLGMTGKLLYQESRKATSPPPYLALHFALTRQRSLFYADVRRFGLLKVLSPSEWEAQSERLGPEPLGRQISSRKFFQALQTSRSPVRSWLLDQRRIAGVGNIYAAEALFLSGVHPQRPARSLVPEESKALLAGIRHVLRKAIRAKGTTLRNYRTVEGKRGGFGSALKVYGREGRECFTCKEPIVRIVFGNRSAFFCPYCQPEIP